METPRTPRHMTVGTLLPFFGLAFALTWGIALAHEGGAMTGGATPGPGRCRGGRWP